MHKAGAVSGAVKSRQILNYLRYAGWLCGGLVITLVFIMGASAQQGGSSLSPLPTTTHLSADAVTGSESNVVTFAIKVQGGEHGVPSGPVMLSNGHSSLGSVLLDENGSATYTAAAGSEHITAMYEGDGAFAASSSPALALPLASTVPTFTLSATPTTLTVKAGNFVTTTVTVTPANGFADPVLLSCSGLPANSTCSFNPTNVVPAGKAPATTSADSILTIQTLAPSGAGTGSLREPRSAHPPLYALLLPGFLALAGVGLLRRRAFGAARVLGLAALMLGTGLGLGACSPRYSYFHHPPLKDPGTTLGTATVLVNGSSASAGSVIIPPPVQIVLTVTK